MFATYKNLVYIILTGLFLMTGPPGIQSQETLDPVSEHIVETLNRLEYNYPQQKAFIHLDKEEYLAGEHIWMKVYLVNATTHRPDTLSTNFYVELINKNGDLASVQLMRLRNGFSHGDIRLPDSISEGNYQLRAYTDWMNNFGEDFFFTKDICVYNPIEENYIRRWDVWRNRLFNRRLERTQEDMQFAFFPEGGQVVEGLENRVAFKAANALGAGVAAEGQVLDNGGNTIARFSTFHNGMGSFSFVPEAGKRYEAEIEFDNGDTKSLKLPNAISTGYLLSAEHQDEAIEVRVQTNFLPADMGISDQIYLLAQTRGRVSFIEEAMLTDGEFNTRIPLERLPTGISQIKLFNAYGQPISERLVFVQHSDIGVLDYVEYTLVEGEDEQKMQLGMALSNDKTKGSYSLAVIDTEKSEADYRSNIATELLLFGDLADTAKDPWYYLSPDSEASAKAADLIMMTHGWRRFDWQKILDGQFPRIAYGFPKGITFAGQVSPRASDRETGEVDVELAVYHDEVNIYATSTDRRGNFVFSNLDYTGDFSATLRLDQPLERRSMRVDLASKDFDELKYEKNFNTRHLQVTSRGDDWERVKHPQTIMKSRGLLEPSRERISMYSDPDQVIYFEDIRDQHSNIMDVLRTRVRGLRVVGGEIMLRGPSSFRFTNEPVFMIDEVMVDRTSFLSVSVHEVDRMTVISGPQSAILGSRGANGALLIYTRRGDDHRHVSYEYLLKGFHEPSETFESRINTDVYAKSRMNRTLFWEPYAETNDFGEIDVSFPVDRHVRHVRVILQGIDENGRITFSDQVITGQSLN